MPSHQKCCQCLNFFSMVKLPRKLPNCPHSICEPCLREIIDTKQEVIICGFCSSLLKKHEIRVFSLNTVILLSLSQVPVVQKPTPIEEQNQLLGDLIQSSSPIVQQSHAQQLCPTHKVVMDIVCISDRHRICPHCALFGNHKDHRFKRLEDFEKEITQKRKIFAEIQVQKESLLKSEIFKIYQQMKGKIQLRKAQLMQEVELQQKKYAQMLKIAKQKAINDVEELCSELQKSLSGMNSVTNFQKSKKKFHKWQKTCLQAMEYMNSSPNVEEKLYFYYQGPLEIVTEGFIFIDELKKYGTESISKLNEKINEIKLNNVSQDANLFEKVFTIQKSVITRHNSIKSTSEDVSESNPFIDCSQIIFGQNEFLNNTSLEAQLSTLSRQFKGESRTSVTPKKPIKSIRSIEKEKPRNSAKVYKLTNTPKMSQPALKRPTSQIINNKFSPRLVKTQTVQEIIPESEVKPVDLKEPQKIYLQFSKNTLSDFFDISQCNLPGEKAVEYVHRARKIHKIRGLKLCNNKVNTAGFEKMTEFLQGVSNINLANNIVNEGIFDVIVRHKERLQSLRVLNLSHNPINLEKKSMAKMEEVKKFGIILIM